MSNQQACNVRFSCKVVLPIRIALPRFIVAIIKPDRINFRACNLVIATTNSLNQRYEYKHAIAKNQIANFAIRREIDNVIGNLVLATV